VHDGGIGPETTVDGVLVVLPVVLDELDGIVVVGGHDGRGGEEGEGGVNLQAGMVLVIVFIQGKFRG
jgi:hypothetical protein